MSLRDEVVNKLCSCFLCPCGNTPNILKRNTCAVSSVRRDVPLPRLRKSSAKEYAPTWRREIPAVVVEVQEREQSCSAIVILNYNSALLRKKISVTRSSAMRVGRRGDVFETARLTS